MKVNYATILPRYISSAPDKLSSQASESDLESSSIHFLYVHLTTSGASIYSFVSNSLFATPCSETNKLPCGPYNPAALLDPGPPL